MARRLVGPGRVCGAAARLFFGACAVCAASCSSPDPAAVEAVAITGPAGSTPPDVAYAPQPDRSFIWIGRSGPGQQFSEAQLLELAASHDIVVLAKFHAGFDIEAHHQAARRLVAIRPDLRVLPYFSMRYWFDKSRWGDEVERGWLLRGVDGAPLERAPRPNADATPAYVDLADPQYRRWAVATLASWLRAAPYAGVAFDAVLPLGGGDAESVAEWEDRLGPQGVANYDRGLQELLAEVEELAGPDRTVLVNGIAPNPSMRGEDRNLHLLDHADAALDERFCLDARGRVHHLDEDIGLLVETTDDLLLMRTSLPDGLAASERERLERFCLGVFLLGWQPGLSYFHVGSDYTAAQIERRPPDLDVNLGEPLGPLAIDGDLAQRPFEHGVVVVNLGGEPVPVRVQEQYIEVRGGRVRADHAPGASFDVPPTDVVLLLRGSSHQIDVGPFLPTPDQ